MFTTISHYLRLFILSGLFLTSLGLAGIAHAVPVYYTFSGTVSSSSDNSVAASYGLSVGTDVSYTFMVDLDLAGSVTQNGTTTPYSDTATVDYFYVDYVGGSENAQAYRDYDEYNVGEIVSGSSSDLTGGNNLFMTELNNNAVSDWVQGDLFLFTDLWTTDLIDYDVIGFATLTGISASNPYARSAPVPETTSLLLLGAGLLGLGCRRRRCQA